MFQTNSDHYFPFLKFQSVAMVELSTTFQRNPDLKLGYCVGNLKVQLKLWQIADEFSQFLIDCLVFFV